MRAHGRQRGCRGQAPVALIIFVVLTLAAGGACFAIYQLYSRTKTELTLAAGRITQLEAELQATKGTYDDLKAAAGWETGNQIRPALEPQKALAAPAGAPEQVLYPRAASARELLQQLLSINERYYRMLVEKHQAFEQENRSRLAAEADKNLIIMKREEEIGTIKKELSAEMQRLEKARDSAKEALARESEAHSADVEALRRAQEELAKVKTDLVQAKERITLLTSTIRGAEKETGLALAPDGRIVTVSREYSSASIDLGRADAIRPGMQFTVFRDTLKGRVIVGQVEVRATGDLSSQVAIIETTKGEPVIEGDMIGNAAYDRNRPVVFVFAGNLRRYTAEQAKRIAAAYGAQVSDTISPAVSYLVIGQEPGALAEEARALGVPVMTEDDFLRFVGRP